MTKLCSVCGTENRDEVQFCRSCGTAFPPLAAPAGEDAQLAAGITCDECGFQNKPGVRYCANCGVSLLGTVIVPRSRAGVPSDPYQSTSPPPITYPSFAPVAPYPAPPVPPAYPSGYPPVASTNYPPSYDDPLPVAGMPDASTVIGAPGRREDDDEGELQPAPFASQATAPAAKSSRAGWLIGLLVVVLVAAGAGGWWFMSSSSKSGGAAAAASAPVLAEPAPAPAPAPVAPPAVVEPAPAVAATPASAPDIAALPPPPAAVETPAAPPGATALPDAGHPPATASNEEAKRVAAQKRREKAAKDKADREARMQAEQQAAAARADQDAARRRAEDAQRARQAAVPIPAAPVPPVQAKSRGVREICAGRGFLAESICQSRECGAAEHAGEALCKRLKEAEDRRRNLQN